MKRYFNFLVALTVTLFASLSFAFTPPPAPANGFYVSDQTGKLSTAQVATLNHKIDQISKTSANQFGVLLLQNMDGDSVEDVAYTTFNAWGIGKKGLDNGILIVVSLQERKSRIETGKGVGGEVTDVQSSQILGAHLNPHLKKGEFAEGFSETIDAVNALLDSRKPQKTTDVSNSAAHSTTTSLPASYPATTSGGGGCDVAGAGTEKSGFPWFRFFLGVLTGFVIIAWWRRRSAKREAARLQELENDRREREAEAVQRLRNKEKERLEAEARRARHASYPVASPPIQTQPTHHYHPAPISGHYTNSSVTTAAAVGVTAGVAAAVLATEAEKRAKAAAEETRRQEREEEERRAEARRAEDRRRREREEEDDRRRRREEDDRRSSYSSDSSSSSYSSDSFSSGFDSGSSSGGGFDGGSSGGGGASSDW